MDKNTQTKERLVEIANSKELKELQLVVNELSKEPQYRQYVEQHKMSLISGKFATIDKLLDIGLLRA